MVINSNQSAFQAARLLRDSSTRLAHSLARLSSGSRIISPEVDAAGLGVSAKLSSENRRHQAAESNLLNAISLSQTQDGYLQKIQKALDRMSELSVLALDVTKTDTDRGNYDTEFQKLRSFVDASFRQEYNGIGLFSGGSTVTTNVSPQSGTGEFSLTVDTQGTSGQVDITFNFALVPDEIRVYYPPRSDGGTLINSTGLVLNNGTLSASFGPGSSTSIEIVVDEGAGATGNAWDFSAVITASSSGGRMVTTDGNGERFELSSMAAIHVGTGISSISAAQASLGSVKHAIDDLARGRATIGANLARLKAHVDELGTLEQNLAAATSRITDVDVAEESTRFARNNILVQSGTAMLAQANLLPDIALRLLGG
jgi:flagellin